MSEVQNYIDSCDGEPEPLAIKTMLKLQDETKELKRILRQLLDEIESLYDYELTRDTEPYKAQACWDYAMDAAYKAVKEGEI